MNKKSVALLMALAVLLVVSPACKKKEVVAGKADAKDMLTMLPENAALVISFDCHQFSQLALFDKAIAGDWGKKDEGSKKIFKDYQEFVTKTGIDLKKDLFFVSFALYGQLGSQEPEGVGVVNMKYDRQRLLTLLLENQVTVQEEIYQGVSVYSVKDAEKKIVKKEEDFRFAFLNPSNILFGTPAKVKSAIDLAKGKGQNILKTASFKKYFAQIKADSMFWLVLGSLPEAIKSKPQAGSQVPVDLSKAEAFLGYLDFKNKMLSGQFQLISHNEEGNKGIVDLLNGLKALGAMGSTKEPELAELLNGINLTSNADQIKLTFSISDAVLNKLGEKAKEKAATALTAPAVAPEAEPSAEGAISDVPQDPLPEPEQNP